MGNEQQVTQPTERWLSQSQIAEMLHRRGVRPSVQRIAILAFVANKRLHPSADEIFNEVIEEFPTMSRTTVYNSLHVLVDAGLLLELDMDSGNRRYDFAPQPAHGHFVCRTCGKIVDMPLPSELMTTTADGFSIDSVDVYYKGLCTECRNK